MLMAGRLLIESRGDITNFDTSAVSEEARSAMVGDRRCDLRAGNEYGIRSFYSPQHLGLASVVERILNPSDTGDDVFSAPQ
jgi:histidinol phosphatase-like enzyme